jgi:hypothetical protein
MSESAPRPLAELFLRQAINRLRHDYLPKIKVCVERLSDEQIWWRPNPRTNSVGNLLLHLEGNLRQWMVHGLGKAIDIRRRDLEFSSGGGKTREELLRRLDATIKDAEEVICGLAEEVLTADHVIQGYRASGVAAVFHAIEHFAGHTGQIVWITKSLTGEDLKFYAL